METWDISVWRPESRHFGGEESCETWLLSGSRGFVESEGVSSGRWELYKAGGLKAA